MSDLGGAVHAGRQHGEDLLRHQLCYKMQSEGCGEHAAELRRLAPRYTGSEANRRSASSAKWASTKSLSTLPARLEDPAQELQGILPGVVVLPGIARMAPNPVAADGKNGPVRILPEIVGVQVVFHMLRHRGWMSSVRAAVHVCAKNHCVTCQSLVVVQHVVTEHCINTKQLMMQPRRMPEVSVDCLGCPRHELNSTAG